MGYQTIENKKELSRFILDLCDFTLDDAGIPAQAYAFHLHIAFRHQTIVQAEKWQQLGKKFSPTNPLPINEKMDQEILDFAQTIIDEVQKAQAEPWALKLLKAGYLSHLDKLRNNSETAIKRLTASQGLMNVSNISISNLSIDEVDADRKEYVKVLQANIAYLDSLFMLPYMLEKLVTRVANNSGITYQPQKTTQMLVMLLDGIRDNLKGYNVEQDKWVPVIKVAIQATMPELPLDTPLLDNLINEVFPLVKTIIAKTEALDEATKELLPIDNPPLAAARKTLLTTMGVQLEMLENVVENTFINPLEESANYLANLPKTSLEKVKAIFNGLEKMVETNDALKLNLLPAWLRTTNDYYQQLSQKGAAVSDAVNTAYEGLGIFYNKLASFIPEVVKQYFTCVSDYEEVLGKTEVDIGKMMAYFSFCQLANTAKLSDVLKELFFTTFMAEVHKSCPQMQYSYDDYCSIEKIIVDAKLLDPLATQMEQFAKNDLPAPIASLQPQQVAKFAMIYQLKNLENAMSEALAAKNYKQVKEIINALQKALVDQNPELNAFKHNFLQPASKRMLLMSMKKYWLPVLEQVIDNPDSSIATKKAFRNTLPPIYSKLKNNIRLSVQDYDDLCQCFTLPEELKNVLEAARNIEELVQDSTEKKSAPLVKTPRQKFIYQLKNRGFEYMKTGIDAMLTNLDNQRINCQRLKKLSTKNSALAELCKQKIAYINAVKTVLNDLNQQLTTSDDMAQELIKLISGESVMKVVNEQTPGALARQLVNFAWYVMPADSKNPDDNLLSNLLNYYLKGSELKEIIDKRDAFNKMLNEKAIPELLPLLSDPLSVTNLLPSEEEVLDTLIAKVFGTVEGQAPLASVSDSLRKAAHTLTEHPDQKTISALFPFAFIGKIVYELLQNNTLRADMSAVLLTLADKYENAVVGNAEEIIKAAKDKLYPLLGIELQRLVEKNALDYAAAYTAEKETNDNQNTAFALYYLRYRAIKRQNSAIKPELCLAFLFKTIGFPNEERFKAQAQPLIALFEKMDQTIWHEGQESQLALNNSTKEQLLFLLQHVDFSNAENDDLIRVYLINTLLLMSLKAQNAVDEKHQQVITDDSDEVFKVLLEQLQTPEPVATQEEEDDDFTKVQSPKRTTKILLNVLEPAQKKARENYLNHLTKMVSDFKVDIDKAVSNCEEILRANIAGKTVAEVEYERTKNNPYRRAVWVVKGLFEVASLLGTWVPLIMTFFGGGNIALQLLLTTLGVAGIVGASASVFGMVLFGIVIATRFTVKLASEIWRHRKEFNDIANNPDYSGVKKVALITLVALKCLGLAALKTLFTDLIVDKISTLLGIKPLTQIANALKTYPEADKVEEEKEILGGLQQQLQAMQEWLSTAPQDPQGDDELAKLHDNLITAMDKVNAALKDKPIDTKKFTQIMALVSSLQTLQAIREIGKPIETTITQQPSDDSLTISSFSEMKESPIKVEYDRYLAKQLEQVQPEKSPPPSLFFRMVAYAGALFRPAAVPVTTATVVTDVGTSQSLDTQTIDKEFALDYEKEINEFMNSMETSMVMVGKEPEPESKVTQSQLSNNRASFWPPAEASLTTSAVEHEPLTIT